MRPGQVIARRGPLVIRTVRASDARSLQAHINALVAERAPVLLQQRQSLQQEHAYVRGLLSGLGKKDIPLVAEWDGELAGSAGAHKASVQRHATQHTAMLGLAVGVRFRRRGVGEALLRAVMRCARRQWGTRIFWLDVYRSNKPAQRLYRKLGFRVTGSIPRGAKVRGKVTDVLMMMKGS